MSTADAQAARERGQAEEETRSPGPLRQGRASSWLAYGILIALTVLLYASTFGAGWFEIDDALYVPENPMLVEVSAEGIGRMLSEPYFGNYSPVHLLSYLVDRMVGGLDPVVFHVSNALWAGVCAAGVFALTRRLTGSLRAAWVGGLLFVVHPAHVEAVAWISSRKDLVAAAFAIPSVLAYLSYREEGSVARYALSLFLFLLATAGKLSVVVVPGILWVFDVVVERRALRNTFLDKLPYVAIVAFFALRVAQAQPETNVTVGAGDVAEIGGWFTWLLLGFGDYVIFRPVPSTGGGVALAWGALFAVFAIGPWLLVRRALAGREDVGKALALHAWVLLALVPSQVLGFLYPVSDRYLFFPSVAFVVLLALVFHVGLAQKSKNKVLFVVAAITPGLVGPWLARSLWTLQAWSDPHSVFRHQVTAVSDVNAHEYLALHYLRTVDGILDATASSGSIPGGVLELAEELELDSAVRREWTERLERRPATDALSQALIKRAWYHLERAAELPTERSLPSMYYRRGRVLDLRGDPAAALVEFQRSERDARIHPILDVARAYLTQSLYSQGLMFEKLNDPCRALERMQACAREDARFADVQAQVQRLQSLCEGR